ncbi:hypothetical protein ACFCX0_18520 [Streptomyces sp. NPDC056352]|uniref:hypothetical protein n=1 Tax=Streptomyces sp. NPDC056352 TaxID=3345791 RepID=UPI0035D89895
MTVALSMVRLAAPGLRRERRGDPVLAEGVVMHQAAELLTMRFDIDPGLHVCCLIERLTLFQVVARPCELSRCTVGTVGSADGQDTSVRAEL